MTDPTDIRRVPDLFRPVRVLDGCCCIGGGTEGYRRAFGRAYLNSLTLVLGVAA